MLPSYPVCFYLQVYICNLPPVPWILPLSLAYPLQLVYVAMHLGMSHMYYNIIQGFISSCIAMLVRKVLGGSRLVY
jgi:hypothetical protein